MQPWPRRNKSLFAKLTKRGGIKPFSFIPPLINLIQKFTFA